MADNYEGWSKSRPAMVLHNQIIPLEFPEDIGVPLYQLECIAVRGAQAEM